MGWLIFGNLALPIRGEIFLWTIVIMLVGISSIEFLVHSKDW
jgi:hypothetical protein